MVAAFAVSVLFLLSYLTYHYYVGTTRFTGQGWIRTAYFTLLISHTVLAALVPFLALVTLFRALKGQFPQHRRVARWTLPIWLYVSVTGVLVYLMLYQLYPQTTQEQAESTRLGADTSVSEETTASDRKGYFYPTFLCAELVAATTNDPAANAAVTTNAVPR